MCLKKPVRPSVRPSDRPSVRPTDRPSVRPSDRPVPSTYVGERCVRPRRVYYYIGRTVGRTVGRSDGRSDGRSVGSVGSVGRSVGRQYESAIHEAIHGQFMAIHMFFCNSRFNRCRQIRKTEHLRAILPAGCTPFKILISGNEGRRTVCGDMCTA